VQLAAKIGFLHQIVRKFEKVRFFFFLTNLNPSPANVADCIAGITFNMSM